MGLFDFLKGSRHRLSILKNESAPGVIVWKHSEEDFNTNSKLDLSPGESAIFVYTNKDGKTEYEVLNQSGYLKTNNYPFLRSISNIASGGDSFFHCALYFVRTNVVGRNLKWGTKKQIGPFEDVTHYTFKIAANGSYMYKIVDAGKLINGLLGYENDSVLKEEIADSIRDKIEMEVASSLSHFFRHPEMKASVERVLVGLQKDLSEATLRTLNEGCGSDWGITFSYFTMSLNMCTDDLPEDILATNRQMRQLRASKGMGAFYDKDQIFSMMHEMATTEGNPMADMVGMGAGFGFGTGMAGRLGAQLRNALGDMSGSVNHPTSPMNALDNGDGWGGNPILSDPEEEKQQRRKERKERLAELRELFETGEITQDEYNEQKKKIISEI